MSSYETEATIDQQQQLVLLHTPFAPGQKVKVLIVTEETDRDALAQRWEAFFKHIQSLPHLQSITEAEIQAEIDAYRSGQ